MPVPPFGFSVGDFVACASLIGDIIRALKDSTGSKAEFQALSQTLLSLNQALTISYVACLQWEAAEIPARHKKYYITVLEGMGKEREECIKLLQGFLERAQPYTDAFVEGRGNRITRNLKKVTWLFKKDDVKNLRDELQLHMQALQQFANALFQTQLGTNTEIFSSGIGAMLMSVTEPKERVIKLLSVVQESSQPIPGGLGYAWGTSPTLTENVLLLDATGRRLLLPMLFMTSPMLLHDLLNIMYRGLPGYRKIARREYTIANEDKDGALIDSGKWSSTIRPGMQISLSVIFSAQRSWKPEFCPRCNERTIGPTLPGRRKICHKCQLTFSLFEKEKFVEPSRISEIENDEDIENTNETESAIKPMKEPISKLKQRLPDPQGKGDFSTKEEYYFSRVHYHREVLKPLVVDPPEPSDENYPTLEIEGLPPLHKAAAKGDLLAIMALLDTGENADCPLPFQAIRPIFQGYSFMYRPCPVHFEFKGCTPLHIASWFAKSRAIRTFIGYGANILAEDVQSAGALHYAICGGDHVSVATLLELGANVNTRDKHGKTPLHEACLFGSPLLVSLLLEKGADTTAKALPGHTPLAYAAMEGKSDIIKVFYEYGADINGHLRNFGSPLHLAAWFGHQQTVHTLLECEADICSKDHDGDTPVHNAAFKDHKAVLEVLHASWPKGNGPGSRIVSFDEPDNIGETPLHDAAWAGAEQAVTTLLEYGANICSKGDYGLTPVHLAAYRGIMQSSKHCLQAGLRLVAGLLLEYGLSTDKTSFEEPNKYGVTPLHLASGNGHVSYVQLLLEHGVNINLKDLQGNTALHWACYEGRLIVVQLLLEKGANGSAQDDDGWLPLHHAASRDHHEVLLILLALGADPSTKTNDRRTALHLASSNGYIPTVKVLLQHGVNLNTQTKIGDSAIHRAIFSESEELVRILLDAGCDPYLQDEDGETAIEIANRLDLFGMSKLLAEYMVRDNETMSELFTRLGIRDGVENEANLEAVSNYTEDNSDWEDVESDSESSK